MVNDPAAVSEGVLIGKGRIPFYKKAVDCAAPMEERKILEKVEVEQQFLRWRGFHPTYVGSLPVPIM